MRAAPATAEITPTTTAGVEFEPELCSGGAATEVAVGVMPREGVTDGAGEVAASDEACATAGAGVVDTAAVQSIASPGKLCGVIGFCTKNTRMPIQHSGNWQLGQTFFSTFAQFNRTNPLLEKFRG